MGLSFLIDKILNVMQGKSHFILNARLLPIGLPLAGAAGIKKWVDTHSTKEAIGAATAVLALIALEAEVEFSVRRYTYRKRRMKSGQK
ncbi:MAG TPA: hypothetical protein VKA08_02170 [Balneolales bacterium]|nr:hypothetical protein [Balneolales bacterium]